MCSATSPSSTSRTPSLIADLLFVVKGLAHDFWKDGSFHANVAPSSFPPPPEAEEPELEASQNVKVDNRPLWTGDRSQILQKMWGSGYILPAGDAMVDLLITPLGLTNEKSVLDLTAGLGGLGRKVSSLYGTYVTGLEEDQSLVPIGMMMSLAAGKSKQAGIVAYSPESFSSKKNYDCIVARELFYRIHDKDRFFDEIVSTLKSKGHLVFTDYTLEVEARSPEIETWLEAEGGATPMSLEEIQKSWSKRKCDLRINEDLTSQYKKEILAGLMRFARFLAKKRPDQNTKTIIMKEMETWAHRVAALEQGAKMRRFHIIKH